MILNVWKPKTKFINGKQVIVLYTMEDLSSIHLPGSSNNRVVYKCDGGCDRIYSINRHHLDENRSKNMSERLQVCKSCQMRGSGNPNFENNNKWIDKYGSEVASKMRKNLIDRNTKNNPSKRDDVKNKKGQFIINFENVYNDLSKYDFKLISINGDNKNAKIEISCSNGHIYSLLWSNFRIRKKCKYCYYDSIRIPYVEIDRFEKYSKKVRSLTRFNYLKNISNIDKDMLKTKYPKEYHVDHIFSISDGYLNDVNPDIVASICNLRVITKEDNLRKGRKSEMSLAELMEKYQSLVLITTNM